MDAITVENVTKIFNLKKAKSKNSNNNHFDKNLKNKLVALDKVSFSVEKGEIFGIIGPNGSGKTTLLRTIAGIYHPSSGKINVSGRITPLLQIGTGFHNELVPSENIVLSGMLLGMSKSGISQKVNKIMEFAELEQFENMKLKHFSSGMRARLAFSTALQIDPDIVLVDEIFSVGDISFKKKSFELFKSLKAKNKTIVISTHNLDMLPKFCDRAILLHHGKIILIGKPEEAIKKYKEIS